MLRTKKGFTLIELLVVIVIIGILVAIALPNFIKIKIKAREAEVKQNLHAIQLAIERYATDTSGQYPWFLYGGDVYYNVGTIKWIPTPYDIEPGTPGSRHPFDLFNAALSSPGPIEPHTYGNVGLSAGNMGTPGTEFGDTLAYEGYLPQYPMNPFLSDKAVIIHGKDSVNYYQYMPFRACGGRMGRNMFNLGWSGEGVCIMAYDIDGEPDDSIKLEFPGQFYYHPRFSDGACNADHFTAQYNSVVSNVGPNHVITLGASARPDQVWSHDVAGYDLLAVGDPSTDGMDIDYSISGGGYKDNGKRTGYLNNVSEPNPYNIGGGANYEPRAVPDGIPDYYIIHLSSSQDAKPQGII